MTFHSEKPTGGVLIAEITISRYFMSEHCVDFITAHDGNGETLGITEALGMLRLAEDQVLQGHRDGDG